MFGVITWSSLTRCDPNRKRRPGRERAVAVAAFGFIEIQTYLGSPKLTYCDLHGVAANTYARAKSRRVHLLREANTPYPNLPWRP